MHELYGGTWQVIDTDAKIDLTMTAGPAITSLGAYSFAFYKDKTIHINLGNVTSKACTADNTILTLASIPTNISFTTTGYSYGSLVSAAGINFPLCVNPVTASAPYLRIVYGTNTSSPWRTANSTLTGTISFAVSISITEPFVDANNTWIRTV